MSRKSRAKHLLAETMYEAGAFEAAVKEYASLVAEDPNDLNASANLGLSLFELGAAKERASKQAEALVNYQQSADYLQKFVDQAADTNDLKRNAERILGHLLLKKSGLTEMLDKKVVP